MDGNRMDIYINMGYKKIKFKDENRFKGILRIK